jgi:hypothetical protein
MTDTVPPRFHPSIDEPLERDDAPLLTTRPSYAQPEVGLPIFRQSSGNLQLIFKPSHGGHCIVPAVGTPYTRCCRTGRFWGQHPNIGSQECQNFQTP